MDIAALRLANQRIGAFAAAEAGTLSRAAHCGHSTTMRHPGTG